MNIALLIPSLGGGGAERVAQQIGSYYTYKGNRVYYFLGRFHIKKDYDVEGEVIDTGIGPLDVSSQYGKLFSLINAVKSILRMRELKKKYHIDVSISFMEDFNYLNILSRINDKVIVRVCTILSECEELSGQFLYKKNWIRRVYSRADNVVVMSRFAYRDMRDIYGISENRITVIPNSVALEHRNEGTDDEWKHGKQVIVTIGRLSPEKQQDRLIRAFRIVAEHNSEARLLIVGKGPLAHYLQGLCKIYGLEDRVIFTGFTKYPAYYLRHAKVFVMTSKIEGFSNVTIEAMACGVPVVAADAPGGIQDIVAGGKYGILTAALPRGKVNLNAPPIEEERELGEAILKVLENKKVYEALHQCSLLRAKDYELEKVIVLWNQLIES